MLKAIHIFADHQNPLYKYLFAMCGTQTQLLFWGFFWNTSFFMFQKIGRPSPCGCRGNGWRFSWIRTNLTDELHLPSGQLPVPLDPCCFLCPNLWSNTPNLKPVRSSDAIHFQEIVIGDPGTWSCDASCLPGQVVVRATAW